MCSFAGKASLPTPGGPSAGGGGQGLGENSNLVRGADGPVNLLTGTANYHLKLLEMNSKSNFSVGVDLYYSGAATGKNAINTNKVAPTSWMGMNWYLGFGKIYADVKGTVALADDEYYFQFDNGVVSKIVREGTAQANYTYIIKDAPYWKVIAHYAVNDANDPVIASWTVTVTNGTVYQYGGGNANQYTCPYGSCAVPHAGDDATRFSDVAVDWATSSIGWPYAAWHYTNYAWDLSKATDVNGDVICFSYAQSLQKSYYGAVSSDMFSDQAVRLYTSESYLSSITNNRGDALCFDLADKDPNECLLLPAEQSGPCIPIPLTNSCVIAYSYWAIDISERKYLRSIRYVNTASSQELEKVNFIYSNDAGEVPHLNTSLSGGAKRLLTGFYFTHSSGAANKRFVYDLDSYAGNLAKICEPMTGKSTIYQYGVQASSHTEGAVTTAYVAPIVTNVIQSGGVDNVPDIITNYSYSIASGDQDFDAQYGIAYWRKVTANAGSGNVETEFEFDTVEHLFGVANSVRMTNSSGKIVASAANEYVTRAYGTDPNIWYYQERTKATSMKDGVSSVGGNLACAWNSKNGLFGMSYATNSDGTSRITATTFAYEKYAGMDDAAGHANMLTQVAETKVYGCANFNATTCVLSSAKVVKASYITWSNISGIWRPAATYAWNVPLNSSGLPTVDFVEFSESSPTANGWQLTGTFDKYDAYGNVIQASSPIGISTTTLYGTPYLLPVATVKNAKSGECYFTSFEEDEIWHFTPGGDGLIPRSNYAAKNGQWSGEIAGIGYADAPWRSLDAALSAPKKYTFSGWVYATSSQAEIAFFASVNGPSAETGHSNSVLTSAYATGTWVFLQGSFEAPAGAKYFMIRAKNYGIADVYFDDLKYYPSDAQMNVTYYDQQWRTPVLTVDANECPSKLMELDPYGRPAKLHKVNKKLSSNAPSARTLVQKKDYHLMGENLKVLWPAGGEILKATKQYSISWSGPASVGAHGVDLRFYNGSSWSTIVSSLSNQNTYLWTVPAGEAAGCKIEVRNHDNTSEASQSAGTFSVTSLSNSPVTVTYDRMWSSCQPGTCPIEKVTVTVDAQQPQVILLRAPKWVEKSLSAPGSGPAMITFEHFTGWIGNAAPFLTSSRSNLNEIGFSSIPPANGTTYGLTATYEDVTLPAASTTPEQEADNGPWHQ